MNIFLDSLPYELLEEIVFHLDSVSLLNLCKASRYSYFFSLRTRKIFFQFLTPRYREKNFLAEIIPSACIEDIQEAFSIIIGQRGYHGYLHDIERCWQVAIDTNRLDVIQALDPYVPACEQGKIKSWYTALFHAGEKGRLEICQFILDRPGVNPDLVMYSAAKNGHLKIIEYAIEKGRAMEEKEMDIGSAMHYAAEGGHIEIFNYLRQFLEDPEICWDDIIECIAEGGNMELLEEAFAEGVYEWNLGLMGAAKGGHIKIAKIMIRKGADDFNNAMWHAAERNHRPMIEFLIDQGANDWNLGLQGAAYGGHINLALFMIERGANDLDGALRCAVLGERIEMVKFLVNKGAKNFDFVLGSAATHDNAEVGLFLIQQGATDFETALKIATNYECIQFIQLLFEQGNPVQGRDKALKLVEKNGYVELAELIRSRYPPH